MRTASITLTKRAKYDDWLIKVEGDVPTYKTQYKEFDDARRTADDLKEMLVKKGVEVTMSMTCRSCGTVTGYSLTGYCDKCWAKIERGRKHAKERNDRTNPQGRCC